MQLKPERKFRDTHELLRNYLGFRRTKDPITILYVSGPISKSNGHSVEENIRKLNTYAVLLDKSGLFDIVIDPSAVGDLEAMGHSREEALQCWCSLLASGRVGVIGMVPGWLMSQGACKEFLIAKKHGLGIIYL